MQALATAGYRAAPKGRGATLVIAASDTPAPVRRNADVFCSGTDDQVKINAAITSLTAGRVILLQGSYDITAAVTPKSGIMIVGEGPGITTLFGRGTDFWIVGGNATKGDPWVDFSVMNMTIDGTGVSNSDGWTSATKGIHLKYVKRGIFRDLHIYNTPASGLGIDFLVDTFIHNCVIEKCGREFPGGTLGGNGIGIGTGAYEEESVIVSDCHTIDIGNNGILFEQQSIVGGVQSGFMRVANCTARGCGTGFRNSGAHRLEIIGSAIFDNTGYGMRFDQGFTTDSPKEQIISSCRISGNGSHGILLIDVHEDGIWQINGSQIHDNGGHGIYVAAAGSTPKQMSIVDNHIFRNNERGLYFHRGGTNYLVALNQIFENEKTGIWLHDVCVNIDVKDNLVFDNGLAETAGDLDGISLKNTPSNTSFTNVRVTGNRCHGNKRYGIIVPASVMTDCEVSDNDVTGNTTDGLSVLSTSDSLRIKGNRGYNPVGVSAITVGTSPFEYTAGSSPETVYISGGTVSAIAKSETTLFSDTGHAVELQPNESLTVTYSSEPTMVKDVH